jgi:hypothetical protein
MSALQGLTPASENAHSLSLSLLAITEKNASPSSLPMLNWAYKMTPCGNCRLRALKLLHELGGLTQEIIQECLVDGDEDIRQFAETVQGAKEAKEPGQGQGTL